MINLLPPAVKRETRAARTNVALVRYIVILAFSVLLLLGITTAVYFVLKQSQSEANRLIQVNETKASSYSAVQSQVTAFQSSLASAQATLNQSVSFSSVLTGIAAVMPAGTVLDSLSLTSTTFGSPTTLLARAKSNDTALQLKDNFQASPLFSNVSIQSLSSTGTATDQYPIAITLSLTINKVAAQ